MRSNVVFPAPLSPRIAYKRPASKLAFKPRRAAKRPNCLTRSATMMTESGGAGALGIEVTGYSKANEHHGMTSLPLHEADTNFTHSKTIGDLRYTVVVPRGYHVHTICLRDPGCIGSLVVGGGAAGRRIVRISRGRIIIHGRIKGRISIPLVLVLELQIA